MFKRKIFVLILVFFFLAGTLVFAGHSNKQIELKPYAKGEVSLNNGAYDDWGYSVVQTQDGGYAFAGISNAFTHGGQDILVYRLDSNGNKVWRKNYGGMNHEFGWWTWAGSNTYGLGCQITNISDGGFIVIASTESFTHGSGDTDFIVYKLDSNGNKVWRKNYGGTSDDFGYSVDQTSDGGYIITGGSFSFTHGRCDFLVYKLDANGNKQWRKNYGGMDCDRATYIEQTSDGGYIVGGRTRTFVHEGGDCKDFLAYKLDANGNKQWRKNYGGNWGDAGFTIHQTTDGGYIFAGMTRSFVHDSPGPGWSSSDFLIYKLDTSGNKVWRKNLGGEYYEEAYSVVQTSDGGYAVTGYTDTFTHGSSDFLVYKLDSNGNKQWRRNYGGTATDAARSIIQTNDGGYAIAGQTLSFVHTPGYWDFLLYKANSNGVKQWRKNYGK